MKDRIELLNKYRHVAPIGNQYWKTRNSHGKEKIFDNPETLWNLALDYFDWCIENPLCKLVYFRHRGEMIEVETEVLRPFSVTGLCIHLGISRQTFLNYSKKEVYRDYFEVCELIRDVIFDYNLSGALVRLIKPCVVARELSKRTSQV